MDTLVSYIVALRWGRTSLALLAIMVLCACSTATPIAVPSPTPQQQPSPSAQATKTSLPPTITPLPPQPTPTSVLSALVGLGHIAFVSDRDGSPDIYTMRADGSELTKITDSVAGEDDLSASPDGNRIAFVYLSSDIYTINRDGSELSQLTNSTARDAFPSWSSDGANIIFSSDRDPIADYQGPPPEIYLMGDNGASQTRVTWNVTSEHCPSLSPDGQQILTSSFHFDYETSRIDIVNRDGSAQRLLVDTPGNDFCPVWSPDGTRIAFSSNNRKPASGQIWVANPDGSNLTLLLDDEEAILISKVSWSPDSRWLAFSFIKADNQDIYLINLESQEIINLTAISLAGERDPTWLP